MLQEGPVLCAKILNQWIHIFWNVPPCHWLSGSRHLPASSGSNRPSPSNCFVFDCATLKIKALLHNVWNHSPSDTMSHPRRPESLAKLLSELHNLQLWQHSTLLWLCSPSPSQQSGILMTGHLKVSMLLQVKQKHGHICMAQWQCYFFSILSTSYGQHGASGRTVRASLHPNLDV